MIALTRRCTSERQVLTFPLDALDPMDPMAGLKRAKRISSHTSFFKAGFCLGKVLVCVVKSSQLSSTFKTLEPIDQNIRGRSKPTFRKLLQGGNDTLKLFRVCSSISPVHSLVIHLAVSGILYPCRVNVYPLSQDENVCWVLERFRDCRSRKSRHPRSTRSKR